MQFIEILTFLSVITFCSGMSMSNYAMNVRQRCLVVRKQNCKFRTVPVPSVFTHFEVNRHSTGTRMKEKTIIFFI
jgi:hypothetical protein